MIVVFEKSEFKITQFYSKVFLWNLFFFFSFSLISYVSTPSLSLMVTNTQTVNNSNKSLFKKVDFFLQIL